MIDPDNILNFHRGLGLVRLLLVMPRPGPELPKDGGNPHPLTLAWGKSPHHGVVMKPWGGVSI